MLKKSRIQRVVESVCRRARKEGFVLPAEIRDELTRCGLAVRYWTEVVSLAGDMLTNRDGRFYYSPATSAIERERRRQRRIHRAVRRIIRGYKSSAKGGRRSRGRVDFIQPVRVETVDGRCVTLLSSNLSVDGIRLIGRTSLLGQKVRVFLRSRASDRLTCLAVRIVWSSMVSEGLYECGGAFLKVLRGAIAAPRIAPPANVYLAKLVAINSAQPSEIMVDNFIPGGRDPRVR